MEERTRIATAELIKRIPLDQVPSAIAFLAARLLTENYVSHRQPYHDSIDQDTKTLLTASELAGRLNLPETWVRNEERLGRIPSIRAGKYARFKQSEVENTLAEKKHLSPKSRSLSGS